MAAVDRRNPDLDDFAGLNWSCWVDRLNLLTAEGINEVILSTPDGFALHSSGSEEDKCGLYGNKGQETMTLRKEDMQIFGCCPALDDFYLVVCSDCGQVVKPQAFEQHCERRHGPLTKLCGQSSTLAPQQRPRPGHQLNILSPREQQKGGGQQEAGGSSAPSANPQHRPAKAQKEAVSLLTKVETSPQETPPPPPSSSTCHLRVPSCHEESLPLGALSSSSSASSSLSKKPALQKPVADQSDEANSPLRVKRTCSQSYKKVNKKECDLDKHCGVLDPDRKTLCTRQLTCNIHSIHKRRKVFGRSKTFDQLVAQQRMGSLGRDVEKRPPSREPQTPKGAPSRLEAVQETPPSQHNKRSLSRSCSLLRESLKIAPKEDGDGAVEVEVQPPYPFNQSLLSSEESEAEEQEDATDIPATPWHPKPLGICTFGSRTLGCSVFTFDRRLHHLRFALSAMVEQHISAHLWKKIPQVSTGLRSRNATTSIKARASSSTSGQSETKSSQRVHSSTKPHSSILSPAGPRMGRTRNLVDRPAGFRGGKLREERPDLRGQKIQKATKLSQGSREPSSKPIRDFPLHEKGQPQPTARVPSSPAPFNGHFSLGRKPCLPQALQAKPASPSPVTAGRRSPFAVPQRPPQHSPRSRARAPAAQRKVAGLDQGSLAQKRKTNGVSPALSPSPSRASKSHCLAPQSHSSLFPWKGASVSGVLARGVENNMDP